MGNTSGHPGDERLDERLRKRTGEGRRQNVACVCHVVTERKQQTATTGDRRELVVKVEDQ